MFVCVLQLLASGTLSFGNLENSKQVSMRFTFSGLHVLYISSVQPSKNY